MSESRMWTVTRSLMIQAGLYGERRDDKRAEGVADVDYVQRATGWGGKLELKYLAQYPQRSAKGLLDYAGLRPDQALWNMNWARNGGVSGILLRVTPGAEGMERIDHWYYWRAVGHPTWAKTIREAPVREALDMATALWRGLPDPGELALALLYPGDRARAAS